MGRLGFLLGFLVGAGIAALVSLAERPETQGGLPKALQQQLREALRAGQEAARQKQAEMRRRFEEATRRRGG